jgi:hypothetical protein
LADAPRERRGKMLEQVTEVFVSRADGYSDEESVFRRGDRPSAAEIEIGAHPARTPARTRAQCAARRDTHAGI